MPYRLILVGTGGQGRSWCERFIPPNVADGLVEVVAAVDVNADALQYARTFLGLRADQCYSDARQAMDENPADFVAIVTPPAWHEPMVDLALAHDLHILSEKPIADTLEASIRVANKVAAANKKMGVTMSHRFDQDKTTLRAEVKSGRYGRLDYLACRVSNDNRKFASWGRYRHEMPDPLMIEAAGHRLDILADLAGAPASTLYVQTWKPAWGEYQGDCQALGLLNYENGVRAQWECVKTNAVGLNPPGREYLRAECEGGTLILSNRQLQRFVYDPARQNRNELEGQGEVVPLLEQAKWANAWLIEKFVHWLDGGEPMETNVWDNVRAVAMTWAAIESSRSGQPVQMEPFLEAARQRVAVA